MFMILTLRDFQRLLLCLDGQCSVLLPAGDIGDDTLRDALRGHLSNFFHPWRHKNVSDLVYNALLNLILWNVLHDFLLQRDLDDLFNELGPEGRLGSRELSTCTEEMEPFPALPQVTLRHGSSDQRRRCRHFCRLQYMRIQRRRWEACLHDNRRSTKSVSNVQLQSLVLQSRVENSQQYVYGVDRQSIGAATLSCSPLEIQSFLLCP